jgi:hypothetical protein
LIKHISRGPGRGMGRVQGCSLVCLESVILSLETARVCSAYASMRCYRGNFKQAAWKSRPSGFLHPEITPTDTPYTLSLEATAPRGGGGGGAERLGMRSIRSACLISDNAIYWKVLLLVSLVFLSIYLDWSEGGRRVDRSL